MLLLYISIILYWSNFTCGQTTDEILNNPNNFHMFENFELTRIIYQNETKIVEKLKEMKETLLQKKALIEKILEQRKSKDQVSKTVQLLKSSVASMKSDFAQIKDLSYEFPNTLDYVGMYNIHCS